MFSALGWIWIEEPPYEDDLGEYTTYPRERTLVAVAQLVEAFAETPAQTRRLTWGERLRGRYDPMRVAATRPPQARLEVANGIHVVLIHTHRNHYSDWPSELFEALGRKAGGSFGFLHTYGDEQDDVTRFRRWTMVHRQVDVRDEASLDPVTNLWDNDAGNP